MLKNGLLAAGSENFLQFVCVLPPSCFAYSCMLGCFVYCFVFLLLFCFLVLSFFFCFKCSFSFVFLAPSENVVAIVFIRLT